MKTVGREAFLVMPVRENSDALKSQDQAMGEIGYFEEFYMADERYVMKLQPCT